MFKYALVDSSNICYGISRLSEEVVSENMILVEADKEEDIIGRKYANEKWEMMPKVESKEKKLIEPTNCEIMQLINDLRAELEIAGVIS